MEVELVNLNLMDEKEVLIQFHRDWEGAEEDYRFCLVEKAWTNCVIYFSSLRKTLVDLWHPLGGVSITDIGEKRYLFRFYYEIDIKRVIEGHREGFCLVRMTIKVHEVKFSWDASLRVPSRREAMVGNRWLNKDSLGSNQVGGNLFGMNVDGHGEGRSFGDIQIVNPYLNSWARDGVMTR
ncbi:hypothetical protein Golob_013609 [Gossypium lobatum]|uniref:DUF4283 domain-containing protein n=1 Tax=Gossypium lobatum TaxID=34289 RepID=A0A7J8LPX7_9ROSI|nr:hypothetical protein [Gossypium lobatum]